MEKELITREYNGVDVHFELINGESYVSIEDVAMFCGWTTITDGKEYPRMNRVNEKLNSLGFANVGKNDFIPENIMYPLIGMADLKKNTKARDFMLWVGKVIAEIRQTGSYTLAKEQYTVTPKEELECLNVVSGILNFNDNSKLIGVRSIYDKYGMETSYLPVYTPSKGVLKSPTALLKQFNVDMSTIEFNKKLIEHGILRECERQSTKDKNKVKKFKNLVDTTWGENQTSPKNPKETQPLYYEDKFMDLLKKLGI